MTTATAPTVTTPFSHRPMDSHSDAEQEQRVQPVDDDVELADEPPLRIGRLHELAHALAHSRTRAARAENSLTVWMLV